MASHVLITMQVTTQSMALGSAVEERLAALVRECFDTDAERASISVQPYDPDAADDTDTCAQCGCVIGDPEQHVVWHAAQVRALGAPATAEAPPMRTFAPDEEPCHAT